MSEFETCTSGLSRRTFLKGAAVIAAMASLSAMGPYDAFAADTSATLVWPEPTGARNNTIGGKSVLRCYAPSTNTVVTEMLGLSNPSFYKQEYTEHQADPCTSPTLGVWGSSANAQPNDYYSNLIYKAKGHNVDETYVAVLGSALQGVSQASSLGDDGIPLFLTHRPEVCAIDASGTWSNNAKTTMSQFVKMIQGFKASGSPYYQEGDENYNPTFVSGAGTGKLSYMYGAWKVARAAQELLDNDSTKTARYGKPVDQAARLEDFMVASQYAVLRAIDAGQTYRKTVAVVGGISDQSNGVEGGVNQTTGRARLDMFDASSTTFSTATQWGTNTRFNVRYYHASAALENCTNNIIDKLGYVDGGDPMGNDPIIRDKSTGYIWARPEALMQCDAIIVRTGTAVTEIPGKEGLYKILQAYGYTDENEWPGIFTNTPQANGYGASNCGSLFWWYAWLFFVYPEVIDPSWMSAYLINNLYHIAESYTSQAMDIICGDMSLPKGYELSTEGYTAAAVETTLSRGTEWYLTNKDTIDEKYPNLAMTTDYGVWLTLEKRQEKGIRYNPTMPKGLATVSDAQTAILGVQGAFKTVDTILVVGNLAAAAIATPLAKFYGGAVVTASMIEEETEMFADFVETAKVKSYVILGSKSSVSTEVEGVLNSLGLYAKHNRFSSASNPALSVAVVKSRSGWGSQAIVASASDAQALISAMAYAYKKSAPIFIVGSSLTSAAKTALKNFKSILVVGSTKLVSAAVAKKLPVKFTRVNATGAKAAKQMVTMQVSAGLKAAGSSWIVADTSSVACVSPCIGAAAGVALVPVANAKVETAGAAVLAKKPKTVLVEGTMGSEFTALYEAVMDAIN